MQNLSKLKTDSVNHPLRLKRRCHESGRCDRTITRTERNRIQWPTPQELQQVSTTLVKVSRWGMRQEEAGDYFNSGDLAYQLHEIIRSTNELLKKSQRQRPALRDG